MFGAVGDGKTDDSTAIQQAIDEAGGNNVVYLSKKVYAISSSLVFSTRFTDFRCDGEIVYSGTDSAIILDGLDNANFDINIVRATNGTALKLQNTKYSVHQCNIHIRSIRGSVVGCHLHGIDANYSIYYNKIRLDEIVSSDINVLIQCDTTDDVNENWFWTGRYYGNGNYGIKIIGGNSNKFFTGDIEGLADTATAIYIENGNKNIFDNFRCEEAYGEKCIVMVGSCTANVFDLSNCFLNMVDISGLTGGNENLIHSRYMSNVIGGYRVGTEVTISYNDGITYDPSHANIYLSLVSSTFSDRNIKQLADRSIPTTIHVANSSTDGLTFTLDRIYSEYLSMARGFPVVFVFGETNGKILLNDNRGSTILDNTNGEYAGKIVSVKWNGYDKHNEKHIWDINILDEPSETVGNKVTHMSQASTDKQYPTAKCVYDAIKKMNVSLDKLHFEISNDGHLLLTQDSEQDNAVSTSIDENGAVFNSVGYMNGYRFTSKGELSEESASTITGFIPCTKTDILRLCGVEFGGSWAKDHSYGNGVGYYCYIALYDANKTLLKSVSYDTYHQTDTNGLNIVINDGITTFDNSGFTGGNVAFVRISAIGDGRDMLVTINEEIISSDSVDLGLVVGSKGATGDKGADGTSVTVTNVSESTDDNGSNVVTFSDGKTVTIKNGSKGSKGDKGDTGVNGSDATVTATNIKNALSYTPASESKAETWRFTLANGETVTKKVVLV